MRLICSWIGLSCGSKALQDFRELWTGLCSKQVLALAQAQAGAQYQVTVSSFWSQCPAEIKCSPPDMIIFNYLSIDRKNVMPSHFSCYYSTPERPISLALICHQTLLLWENTLIVVPSWQNPWWVFFFTSKTQTTEFRSFFVWFLINWLCHGKRGIFFVGDCSNHTVSFVIMNQWSWLWSDNKSFECKYYEIQNQSQLPNFEPN